ncbi:MAG: hypothetical protein DMF82_10840, partial [Acidobacteria bacterium]
MKRYRAWIGGIVLALLALGARPGAAQELRGRIVGTITDNTGAAMSGVVVTASGPSLIQPQTTTSSADGTYRFPALPSGVYTVAYAVAGFKSVRREGIRVNLNTTVTLDTQLQMASVSEELTVSGE